MRRPNPPPALDRPGDALSFLAVPNGVDSTYEQLAFEASQRRLDKQERLLDELRSRTGVLLAAAALAASFLGRDAFIGDPKAGLAIAALAAFLVSMMSSLYILLPKKDKFVFSLVGSGVYEGLFALKDDMPEVYRRLAYAYRYGAIALIAEIVILSVMVGDTIL